MSKVLDYLKEILTQGSSETTPPFHYPPAIAKTLGFRMIAVDTGTSILEMDTKVDLHANPMGTIHGGVLCDLADAAIGTAHSTTLAEGETFTSVDLQINFFRPIWNDTIRATAKPVHSGKTVTRYVCDVTKSDGKLVAQVTSTVMTLRGQHAQGR